MNKKFVIKESRKFEELIKTGQQVKSRHFIIFYQPSCLSYNKYGVSVGKKIGSAVVRNHLKRKTRAILRNYQKNYAFCFDCIIMVRKSCLDLSYLEMDKDLNKLLHKIEEVTHIHEEKK